MRSSRELQIHDLAQRLRERIRHRDEGDERDCKNDPRDVHGKKDSVLSIPFTPFIPVKISLLLHPCFAGAFLSVQKNWGKRLWRFPQVLARRRKVVPAGGVLTSS